MTVAVSSLLVFPVKSCAPILLQHARMVANGLAYDRMWTVAKLEPATEDQPVACWKIVTQRTHPMMALIRTDITPVVSTNNNSNNNNNMHGDHYAEVEGPLGRFDDGGSLTLSMLPPSTVTSSVSISFRSTAVLAAVPESETAMINVHGQMVAGIDEGDEASEWLSKLLNAPVRLFIKHPQMARSIEAKHVPSSSSFSYSPQTAFADEFPVLLVSQASIDDITHKLKERNDTTSVSHLNFRPNILVSQVVDTTADAAVLDTMKPFDEDTWLRLSIGSLPFVVSSRCARCTMPSISPATGTQGKEPTKLLMSYRRVDAGSKYEACVGINMIHTGYAATTTNGSEPENTTESILHVGDVVKVHQTGVHDRRGIWKGGDEPLSYDA
ncbi:hypothetical protein BASA50_000153 [Batrachochytrium salamandrivorans]|uniref:MOSC domain-containing protein n=1 Tax=Batrachochytrium salamandrivorans TaxID=1357716 RepID=A0ABQ8EUI4_9FUNG|nr:hypothetical protein BASA62_004825 [Batrachochytrium salamandrivorans]KAH6580017.1 hypothetical protein BASA60_003058 [Batrachochytrium salamandrivorans]KAH6586788.1 hypothetical protein BASA50_000153 [Batrachochytrium salamandrivorans]KAH6592682.1 hypothetical protein BASA61_004483 [Batrachochytrium salamandrivorans]KAH9264285.1 hypothetical protein BASA83_012239 [Batrachochytrium salamandrivorans]